MSIEGWLTPHRSRLLLAYPAWQAVSPCPLLRLFAAATAVPGAALAMLRELALVLVWAPTD